MHELVSLQSPGARQSRTAPDRGRVPPLYGHPFNNHWARPPSDPLALWSHVALLFTELAVPLPAFMAPFTDLAAARSAIERLRQERELQVWRTRFGELENSAAAPNKASAATPALRRLRLRLGAKRTSWEISAPNEGSGPASRFVVLPGRELRELPDQPEFVATHLDAASTAVVAFLRAHKTASGRTTPRYEEPVDRKLIGQLLAHPHASDCVVDANGAPILRDDRPLVWLFRPDPVRPDHTVAQLGFADGSPAPRPLLHLPGRPDLYFHGSTVFAGLPPPNVAWENTDPAAPVSIPRAALALPEAQRFAVRAGLSLPEDLTGKFRSEVLRARLRGWVGPRRAGATPGDEVMFFELAALSSDGAVRAIWDTVEWQRQGSGIARPRANDAFCVYNFEPTREAVVHFGRNHLLMPDPWHPHGFYRHAEIRGDVQRTLPDWLAGFPKDTLIELAPELSAFTQPAMRAHYALDITNDTASGIDWFDVRVKLQVEDTTLTEAEIALLLKARGEFVRLPGRGWHRLEVESSAPVTARLARLGLDAATTAAETAREPLRFHALQLADDAVQESLPESLRAVVRQRAAALRTIEPPSLPAGLTAELRPYQLEGFHFLAHLTENRFGGVLADDMGLGKTLQALAWLLWLSGRPRGSRPASAPLRTLVVCPKSVVVNWQLETVRFAPALKAAPLDPHAAGSPIPADAHLVIVNYAQLRLHAAALNAEPWDAVVLDEAQNIKNPASATAQIARALPALHRLVLTGTPIENRLLDLWSLFAFAMPGLLGGQTSFKRLYNDKSDPSGARARLALRVKHFLLRRTKSQVARDLPARIEEEIVCELEGAQRTLYDAELKRARQLVLGVKSARQFDAQRFNILQSLLRLRQICCDPRLIQGRAPANEAEISSAKLDALLETLEEIVAEGHRVLVFSQFVTMLELIREALNERKLRHLLLTGQTENRQALVDEFQSPDGPPIFLLSLKAAGSGLNLTAASYVVLFDPWWNPAVEAQAIDRTHRIGQRNQVIAYRLLASNTVEEKIRHLQREKSALATAVVQEESLAQVLDLESLRHILA